MMREEYLKQLQAEKDRKLAALRAATPGCEKGQVVLAGSSLMENLPVQKLLDEAGEKVVAYNRAIGGYTTSELLRVLDDLVLALEPRRVLINIGTNDLNSRAEGEGDAELETMLANYDQILSRIQAALPGVELVMLAYYPVNPDAAADILKPLFEARSNERIRRASEGARELAARHGAAFVDLNAPLYDGEGRLRAEYTVEGLHLNEAGYRAIFPELLKCIKG